MTSPRGCLVPSLPWFPKQISQRLGSESHRFLKTWSQKLTQHYFYHILLAKLSQSPGARGADVDATSHWESCQRSWQPCFKASTVVVSIWGLEAGTQRVAVIITALASAVHEHQSHCHFRLSLRKPLLIGPRRYPGSSLAVDLPTFRLQLI